MGLLDLLITLVFAVFVQHAQERAAGALEAELGGLLCPLQRVSFP